MQRRKQKNLICLNRIYIMYIYVLLEVFTENTERTNDHRMLHDTFSQRK